MEHPASMINDLRIATEVKAALNDFGAHMIQTIQTGRVGSLLATMTSKDDNGQTIEGPCMLIFMGVVSDIQVLNLLRTAVEGTARIVYEEGYGAREIIDVPFVESKREG